MERNIGNYLNIYNLG